MSNLRNTSIAIQLKPREKPLDLPEEYKKSLRNELQVRYLENLGVAPTPANLALVRKNIPPEKCTFKTAWKSRGWVSDTLYISLEDPSQSAPVVATRRAAAAAADLGAIDRLPAALLEKTVADENEGEDGESDDAAHDGVQLSAPSGGMSFQDAQHHFLYPYRHMVSSPRRSRVGKGGGEGSARGSGGGGDAERSS